MKKKLLKINLLLISFLLATVLPAQQKVYINQKSGTKVSYVLQDIRKITFSSNNLVVNKKTGSSDSYLLNNIRCMSFVDISTEVKPLAEEGKVLLFPNPVENVLNIQLPSEVSSGIIQIISLNGSIVHSETICCKRDAFQVEVSSLPKGLYVCKISTEAGIKTIKFNKL